MCLKLKLNIIILLSLNYFQNVLSKNCEKPVNKTKPIFDIRFDPLPKKCPVNFYPNSCAQATQCTQSSGIYNITLAARKRRVITVYCDDYNFDGGWLYILRRNDGSVLFNRTWQDYVKGFGNIAGEFWIGLDNLYDLTNLNGPQELNVYLENFEGLAKIARYDNFAIANNSENYKLKSLGRYRGSAGDSLYNHLGAKFSTFDVDYDQSNIGCATLKQGGFWFSNCGHANPTGAYLRGEHPGLDNNTYWHTFGGDFYSLKTIIFMIRRQNIAV